jgi:hypothetical protein
MLGSIKLLYSASSNGSPRLWLEESASIARNWIETLGFAFRGIRPVSWPVHKDFVFILISGPDLYDLLLIDSELGIVSPNERMMRQ